MTAQIMGLYVSTEPPAEAQAEFKRGYWQAFAEVCQYLPEDGPLNRRLAGSPPALGGQLAVVAHEVWLHRFACGGVLAERDRLLREVKELRDRLGKHLAPPPELQALLAENETLRRQVAAEEARALRADELAQALTDELEQMSAFVVQNQEALKADAPRKPAK